jgi:hypothetical protein
MDYYYFVYLGVASEQPGVILLLCLSLRLVEHAGLSFHDLCSYYIQVKRTGCDIY